MKTALITTGPAIAPIDDVRYITNFATGEIGTLLAETLVSAGWGVHLARGRGSTYPAPESDVRLRNDVDSIERRVVGCRLSAVADSRAEGAKYLSTTDYRPPTADTPDTSEQAPIPFCVSRSREESAPLLTLAPFTTNASVLDFFHCHATTLPIAIFHAAALCDFEVAGIMTNMSSDSSDSNELINSDPTIPTIPSNPTTSRAEGAESINHYPRKLPSTLDTLDLRLRPAPKVLPLLRDLFPAAFIVGWKYEMDGTPDTAIARARAQIAACRTDACVVNGAAWGEGFGLVRRDTSEILPLSDKAALCHALCASIPCWIDA